MLSAACLPSRGVNCIYSESDVFDMVVYLGRPDLIEGFQITA